MRILLVDDQILFVESLRRLLEIEAEDLEVVATATSGREAIRLCEKLEPEMVLLDIRMPELDGVETVRILKERHPQMSIIMLTTFDTDAYIYDALANGAAGYLLKDIPPNELIASIYAVREGGVTVSPPVARKLVLRGAGSNDSPEAPGTLLSLLTKREVEVLGLVAEGHDNLEIAELLNLSEQTVRNYVSIIYSKLEVEKRSQAIRLAKELGISTL